MSRGLSQRFIDLATYNAWNAGAWPPPLLGGETTVWAGSVDVPTTFLGLHYNPGSGTGRNRVGIAPQSIQVTATAWRNHNGPGNSNLWADIHTADNTFNWTDLDAQFAYYHDTLGMKCNFSIYGTPSWLRSVAFNNRGTVADQAALLALGSVAVGDYATVTGSINGISGRRWTFNNSGASTSISSWTCCDDPYGRLGGNFMPSDLSKLAQFVTALIGRYGNKIAQIEPWNEFDIGNITGGIGFWMGTLSDTTDATRHARVAEVARTVYQAAKAANPSITVLSPSTTSDGVPITRMLNGSDGAGGFGRQWVEAVAWHPYRAFGWNDVRHGASLELSTLAAALRTSISNGGLNGSTMPLYITEIAYHWDHLNVAITGTSPAQFAAWIGKSCLRAAQQGVQQWMGYRYDDTDSASSAPLLLGHPAVNPEVAAALNVAKKLCGRRLLRIDQTASGQYRATTDVEQFVVG